MGNRLLCAFVLVVGVGPPLAAQETPQPQSAVESLGALSSRVTPTKQIYVRKTSGEEISGRFLTASEGSLTLEMEGQAREIPGSDVQRVRYRGGNRVLKGMAFGVLAGAAVGASALAASGSDSDSDSDYSVGDRIGFGAIVGGGTGLVWGAIIGAFLHERPVAYLAPVSTVRLTPEFTRSSIALVLRAQF